MSRLASIPNRNCRLTLTYPGIRSVEGIAFNDYRRKNLTLLRCSVSLIEVSTFKSEYYSMQIEYKLVYLNIITCKNNMLDNLTIYDVKIHIAELSKASRKYEGISQEELAERVDMSRITIQNLEHPKNATLDTFLKVMQHFELLEKFDRFITDSIEDKSIDSLY